jgi:hypothetical protein
MAMASGRDAAIERVRLSRIAERYRSFAHNALHGESEIYEKLVLAIAASRELLSFVDGLPLDKRQPQLFLAAVRHLHGVPASPEQLLEIVRRDHQAIRALMLSRTTQTNEPGRCAVLLPLLARLPQPLAIIEVGASAGLCLLPDRYGYDYGRARLAPDESAPNLTCTTTGPVPYPTALPQILWRRGIDLNPIDVRSDNALAWLETLVWPGQGDRAQTLRAAIAVARRDPPPVVEGDLLTDLAPLLAAAPQAATLVVFHSAVLQYVVSPAERDGFVATVKQAGAVWISNEIPGVFPGFARNVPPPPSIGRSLLMLDGVPMAWAGPHGQSLDWFGSLP